MNTAKTCIIDPLNRVEGDMAVEIKIDEKNRIADARCRGFVYRGLENIFIGRKPFDAMRLSQRSCGVCPVSHGTAGARAIEEAAGVMIPRNAQLIRDLVLGSNIIVSHLTHFYFMWGPDLVNEAYKESPLYPEILSRFDPLKSPHLKDVLMRGRIPLHSVVATFGGKFPHPMHAVPGGVTCVPKHIELIKTITRLRDVQQFIEEAVIGCKVEEWLALKNVADLQALLRRPSVVESDVGLYLRAAQEFRLHELGEGTVSRFLSFGFGRCADGSFLFSPGYVEEGVLHPVEPDHISEDTSHAFYETEREWRKPFDGKTVTVPNKDGAYTWIKAPRYFGHAVETGPLARQIVNNTPLIVDAVRVYGVNTHTRMLARLHECLLILPKLLLWAQEIDLQAPFYTHVSEVRQGRGVGFVEAPRGALGHWITVDKGLCTSYQIITPTTWNASPEDSNGVRGAIEKALIGVQLRSRNGMLEAGHIVRAFDPCISCSIHAVGRKKTLRLEPA